MNEPQDQPNEMAGAPESVPATPKPLTNPNLTSSLSTDFEAVRNDLQEANELAAVFQRQLAGKSNEFALLKQLFEKTKNDLVHLQANIVELRQERHRLANEAMRAVAFEMKLKATSEERDQLRADLETARQSLTTADAEITRRSKEPDAMIARLTAKVDSLKDQLAAARRTPGARSVPEQADPEIKTLVAAIAESAARLKEIVDPRSAKSRPTAGSSEEEEFIDISFAK